MRGRTLLALATLAGGLYLGSQPLGPLPPLGPLLEPANGVWAVARRAELPRASRARIPGLTAPVDVRYDDRGVPHIFASSQNDAFRALGYVVARDRLFQLELQTRATAGRLTELLGTSVLALDREQRGLALARSALESFREIPEESRASMALVAYADGVNAWIDGLTRADLPLEYRLLNAWPMRWEPVHSVYLLRRMGYTLTHRTDELRRERLARLVGTAAADALFPVNNPIQEPIQPGAGQYPRYDWSRLPPPGRMSGRADKRMGSRLSSADPPIRPSGEGDAIGSNNWAVAPSRSATGHALLAGDPHLDLTLPSIWYEAHLVAPGLDVYGVTIPGVPGVVIGFNRDVAWTYTNTEADVIDYYVEDVDDSVAPEQYLLNGEWRKLRQFVETYRDRQGQVLVVDTVRATHRGPLIGFDGARLSVRWTVNESADEVGALIAAMEARSADNFFRLIQRFAAPPQNMLVADRAGNIGIRSTGRFPYRPMVAPGTAIAQWQSRTGDWDLHVPARLYPGARNPPRGFVSSANQQPADPRTDTTYYGADWPSPWRAMRINGLLRTDSSVTVDEMRAWQGDRGSARADFFVPYFLAAAGGSDGRIDGPNEPSDHPTIRRSAELLAQWDRRYDVSNRRALLFELAMDRLARLTWDELRDSSGVLVAAPRDAILAQLLQDPASAWWDRSATDGREDRDAILREALADALVAAQQRGPVDSDAWRWDSYQRANVRHLLRIDALSALDLPPTGGPSTISPMSGGGSQGSSWRMVVELGDSVEAWGTYPGGQSGNPVSRRYTDRMAKWVSGALDTLRFPRQPADLRAWSARLQLEVP